MNILPGAPINGRNERLCSTPTQSLMHVSAAMLQARECLVLRLRDHIKTKLPCAELSPAWQQCLHQIQQETCIGPRLALQPAVADILTSMAPSTYVVSLHISQDGTALYCTALRGQQAAAPVKGKPGKQGRTVA